MLCYHTSLKDSNHRSSRHAEAIIRRRVHKSWWKKRFMAFNIYMHTILKRKLLASLFKQICLLHVWFSKCMQIIITISHPLISKLQ